MPRLARSCFRHQLWSSSDNASSVSKLQGKVSSAVVTSSNEVRSSPQSSWWSSTTLGRFLTTLSMPSSFSCFRLAFSRSLASVGNANVLASTWVTAESGKCWASFPRKRGGSAAGIQAPAVLHPPVAGTWRNDRSRARSPVQRHRSKRPTEPCIRCEVCHQDSVVALPGKPLASGPSGMPQSSCAACSDETRAMTFRRNLAQLARACLREPK